MGTRIYRIDKGKYFGCRLADKYHLPHCTFVAGKLGSRNMRAFDSIREAIDAGYAPCMLCLPLWRAVEKECQFSKSTATE